MPLQARGTIVFSHANGFPAGTYRLLLEGWRAAGWRVLAVEKFGHEPDRPVTSNWPHLRDQLLDAIAREAPEAPVHLVGHSMGGYLGLLAASAHPGVARSVGLLDSPVVAGWRAHGLRVVKATGLVGRFSPGRVSRARRQHWPSLDAARAHFASKAVFARWDPRVLEDYLASGLEPDPVHGGVRLAFDRAIETRIYDTLPHHVAAQLKRHPPLCPLWFVGGRGSAEVRQVGMAATRRLTQGRVSWLDGGHLFPMERPDETAEAVLRALQAL